MAQSTEKLKQAITLIKSGDKASAVNLVKEAIKEDKGNANAWYVLATALEDTDKRIKALENTLKLQPDHSRAQALLERLRPQQSASVSPFATDDVGTEDQTATGDAFDEAEDEGEADAGGFAFDNAEEEEADFYGGSPFLEDEEDEEAEDVDPRLEEAAEFIESGKLLQAKPLIQQVLNEDKQNVAAWWLLAHVMEDTDNQIKALKRVLKLQPDQEEAQEWLEELQWQRSLQEEDDADAFFSSIDDDEDDPFADMDDPRKRKDDQRKRKPTPKAGDAPSMTFHVVSFAIMLIIGLGAYFGLRSFVGQDGTVLGSDEMRQSAGLTSGGSLTEECQSVPATLTTNTRDFVSDTGLSQETILRGVISPGSTFNHYKYEGYDTGYVFSASPGQTVTFNLTTSSANYDPELLLYRPDGTLVQEVDSGFNGESETLQYTIDETGDWVIAVGVFSFGCGQYTLSYN